MVGLHNILAFVIKKVGLLDILVFVKLMELIPMKHIRKGILPCLMIQVKKFFE
jgi:hypothetical protein